MNSQKTSHLTRRVIGGVSLFFILFWIALSMYGAFGTQLILPVDAYTLGVILFFGLFMIISRINMIADRKNGSSGFVVLVLVYLLAIFFSLSTVIIPLFASYPVWYISCAILFFFCLPIIDLVEAIKDFTNK